MSVANTRTMNTPEEAKFRQAEAAIELASVLCALVGNPKLLKQLGEEAAASHALNEDQSQQHEAALISLKASSDADEALEQKRQEIAAYERSVHENDSKLIAAHEDRVKKLDVEHSKKVSALSDVAVALEKEKGVHEKHLRDLADRQAGLDGREARLTLREKELESTYKTKHAVLDKLHTDRLAEFDKREKAMDMKAQKLAEAKAALAD